MRFDRELVSRYDVPGPRYTSYPPLPVFRDGFDADEHLELLRGGHQPSRPLSLYLHVPFCHTRCLFCGCNVVISRSAARADAYLDLLIREIERVAIEAGSNRPVQQVHWGGGTPNFLDAGQIGRLGTALASSFPGVSEAEIGVELDPRRIDDRQLDAFAELGVRRVSFGVQDLDPAVQRAVRREIDLPELRRVVEGARRRGVRGVNFDLIYGLPHQTVASFERTLDRILSLAPDRLAVYNFAYLPERFAHQAALDREALPGPEERLAILEMTIERLTSAGLRYLGFDHFARPADPLVAALADGTGRRSFQGYSTDGACDLLGFGVSAISRLEGGFVQNKRSLADYGEAVARTGLAGDKGLRFRPEDRLRSDVIQDLLCRMWVDKAEIEARHGIDFDEHFADELSRLRPLELDGLVTDSGGFLEITPAGQLVARVVAMVFDEYLASSETRFSRVV